MRITHAHVYIRPPANRRSLLPGRDFSSGGSTRGPDQSTELNTVPGKFLLRHERLRSVATCDDAGANGNLGDMQRGTSCHAFRSGSCQWRRRCYYRNTQLPSQGLNFGMYVYDTHW